MGKVGKTFAIFAFFAALFFAADGINAQARKSAQPPALRTVSVASEPGALVIIDGVRYGNTGADGRLTVKIAGKGASEIRVRADGYKEAMKTILPSQKGDIAIPLSKTTDDAELAFQEAERLSSADREKSAEAYLKVIRLRPNYTDAFIGLARVYSDGGSIDKAEKAIRDLRRIKPRVAEASAIQGRIYKSVGDEAKAIAEFKKSITEGKGFQPEAYTGLGILYKERAEAAGADGDYEKESLNYDESAKYLSVAARQLGTAPDASVIYQLLGLVYEQQKKYKEAIAVYEEFLAVFPETADSTAVRSFIVQLKKQMAEQ